jgi:hypothetical protein
MFLHGPHCGFTSCNVALRCCWQHHKWKHQLVPPKEKNLNPVYIWVLYRTPKQLTNFGTAQVYLWTHQSPYGEPSSHYVVMGITKAWSRSRANQSTSAPSIGCLLWLSSGWTSGELLSNFTLVSHSVRSGCCPFVGR